MPRPPRSPRRRSPSRCPRCAGVAPRAFPKSLDTIYGGGETIAKRVAAITGGKFQIRVFGAGEIVPAFGTVDAVQQGTVECTHTASYYFVGKNKTFAFDTTLPFGMNQRQQNAWIYWGGGLQAGARVLPRLQHHFLPGRQHRLPDGRLVPQGSEERVAT